MFSGFLNDVLRNSNESMDFNDTKKFDDPQLFDDPKGISIGSIDFHNSKSVQ